MSVFAYPGIHQTRVRELNRLPETPGRFVLYWMQQSQRAESNHALEYAVREAGRLGLGVLAAFGLAADYPDANLRHYAFMLEGLAETQRALERRGIPLVVRRGPPPRVALEVGRDASLIVCDVGYLRHQRAWREQVAAGAKCRMVQVESDVVVPVEVASARAEIGARTLRPKLHRLLPDYLVPLPAARVRRRLSRAPASDVALHDPAAVLSGLPIDRTVPAVTDRFRGGTAAAKSRLRGFIADGLARYDQLHNQPQADDGSHLSPYLHFGQISPLTVALEVAAAAPGPGADAFLEELVVRRELACNFVRFTPDYDRYAGIPDWARRTLAQHRRDPRAVTYSAERMEAAETGDPYWNAAMTEMRCTGYLHNHMRMYWGKKILEWARSPEEGFEIALRLNNRYFLDGRDPNSYAGVGWVFGVHDRPWPERPVFGKVRSMTASGLERKCDIRAYVQRVRERCR